MAISIQQSVGVVILIMVIGITLGIGARTLDNFSASMSAGTAQNTVNNATEGLNQFGQQMPTIGIIAAAAVILSLIAGGLMVFG